jgi:hypothetical protein
MSQSTNGFYLKPYSSRAICAQEKTVTGVVPDAGGPTPGVNVVKGTKDQFKLILTGEVCNSRSQSR